MGRFYYLDERKPKIINKHMDSTFNLQIIKLILFQYERKAVWQIRADVTLEPCP